MKFPYKIYRLTVTPLWVVVNKHARQINRQQRQAGQFCSLVTFSQIRKVCLHFDIFIRAAPVAIKSRTPVYMGALDV